MKPKQKTTNDWMEKLVRDYRIPADLNENSKTPKKILTEQQLKIVKNKN
jgi:hypothetical protein